MAALSLVFAACNRAAPETSAPRLPVAAPEESAPETAATGAPVEQAPLQLPAPATFELFLLMGQSNMEGCGALRRTDTVPVLGILMLDRHDQWRVAAHPIHYVARKAEGGFFGLGIDFAQALSSQRPGITVGLIPCAVGGSSLDEWQPGEPHYERAVRRARLARANGRLKGVLWHQGETDAMDPHAATTYRARVVRVFRQLREDLNQPDMPIVVGELGRKISQSEGIEDEQLRIINEALNDVPELIANTRCISSEELSYKPDRLHFNRRGLQELGRRYAAAIAPML
jgi:hypothetical protein